MAHKGRKHPPRQTGPPGTPLEVSEAQRSWRGKSQTGGWGDPEGYGTYNTRADYANTDIAGHGRNWRGQVGKTVASSDLPKLEKMALRQGAQLKAATYRGYGVTGSGAHLHPPAPTRYRGTDARSKRAKKVALKAKTRHSPHQQALTTNWAYHFRNKP